MDRRDLLQALGASAITGALDGRMALGLLGRPRSIGDRAFDPDVELELVAAPDRVAILDGNQTEVWRFTASLLKGPPSTLQQIPGSYLGPVIRLRRGQRVRVRFQNRLPEPSIVHWHGLDLPEAADGHPRLAIAEGATYVYEFEVQNRAGTYWYHPHPHHRTGAQVYRGLAGVVIVTDDEEVAAGLPAGPQELVCVLQDRIFTDENQLAYPTGMMAQRHGFLGRRILVNGREQPRVPVGTRAYRLRLLNGSSSRIYRLAWSDGAPMVVIGSDGGLLERPVRQSAVTLAPAQRVDLIVDFSGQSVGSTVELRSAPFAAAEVDPMSGGMGPGGMGPGGMGPGGMGRGGGTASGVPLGAPLTLMAFEVARRESERFVLPERLSTFDAMWGADPGLPIRRIELSFNAGLWTLAGRTFEMTAVADDEVVRAGSSQIWEVANVGGMMGRPMAHPFHMHGPQFRVVSRSSAAGAPHGLVAEGRVDAGWTDTVLVLPHETVRLQVRFTRHPGLYLYHCHLLEHEDLGMMRNFRVVAR